MTEIPKTMRLKPRPVWDRWMRRMWANTGPLAPPTDEEKHDAILILADPTNAAIPGLWLEAHKIFEEASPKTRREALDELTRLSEEMPGGYR